MRKRSILSALAVSVLLAGLGTTHVAAATQGLAPPSWVFLAPGRVFLTQGPPFFGNHVELRSGIDAVYAIPAHGQGVSASFEVATFPLATLAQTFDRLYRSQTLSSGWGPQCTSLPPQAGQWVRWCRGALPPGAGMGAHQATAASGRVLGQQVIIALASTTEATPSHVDPSTVHQAVTLARDVVLRDQHYIAHHRETPLSRLLVPLYNRLTECAGATRIAVVEQAVPDIGPSRAIQDAATAHRVCQALIDGLHLTAAAIHQVKTAAEVRRLGTVLGESLKMAANCSGGAEVIQENLQNPNGYHPFPLSDGIAEAKEGLAHYQGVAVDVAQLIPRYLR